MGRVEYEIHGYASTYLLDLSGFVGDLDYSALLGRVVAVMVRLYWRVGR